MSAVETKSPSAATEGQCIAVGANAGSAYSLNGSGGNTANGPNELLSTAPSATAGGERAARPQWWAA